MWSKRPAAPANSSSAAEKLGGLAESELDQGIVISFKVQHSVVVAAPPDDEAYS